MFTPPRPTREFLFADDGMATVEYAVGLLIGALLASVLIVVVKGEDVLVALRDLVHNALSVG